MHGRRRGRRREWDLMRNCCVRVNGRQEKWRLWRIHFFADLSLSLARQFTLAATANGPTVNLVRLCCAAPSSFAFTTAASLVAAFRQNRESTAARNEQSFLVLRQKKLCRKSALLAARTRARLLWAIPEKERGATQGRRGTEPSLTGGGACGGRRQAPEGQ